MRHIIASALVCAVACLPAVAVAAPAVWSVVPAQSRIGFSGTHAGNAFKGTFGQFAANIRFDPANPAASKVNVVIATASARTGDKFQESSLAGAEWFDPAAHPRATFTTTRIAAAGPGRYIAEGTLTIKGKATPVRLPFTLRIAGDMARMSGTTTLDRIALGMGTKSDPGGAWVSKQIGLTIELTARRAK
ncbi:MAG: cytochrome b561 [Sphingomonas bacterium]|nr:YceI family protein [Sphingomonas bacterium]MDB5690458.1 cytochrome b561 [Sphingomonas bacterium]